MNRKPIVQPFDVNGNTCFSHAALTLTSCLNKPQKIIDEKSGSTNTLLRVIKTKQDNWSTGQLFSKLVLTK